MNEILCGDAKEVLKTLPDESVNCAITSPPYWGLRDYGVAGQIGLEKTPEEFIAKMTGIFSELRRVLKDDGTLWLNIGDSYAGSWGNYGGKNRSAGSQRIIRNGSSVPNPAYDGFEHFRPPTSGKFGDGIKSKDLVGIPWMLAFALRADGWYLRQEIIWHKPNPMPESVLDRCTKSHESVFLLSKSSRYYFDYKAIQEPALSTPLGFPAGWGKGDEPRTAVEFQKAGIHPKTKKKFEKRMAGGGTNIDGHTGHLKPDGTPFEYAVNGMRNRRSVWTVNPMPFSEAHFATFPEKLIEPMVLAGCPRGGAVLDPFMGAGTTAVVAKKMERDYLGIELNPEYVAMANKRLANIPDSLFKQKGALAPPELS